MHKVIKEGKPKLHACACMQTKKSTNEAEMPPYQVDDLPMSPRANTHILEDAGLHQHSNQSN